MSSQNIWSRHYQAPWLERADDQRLPAWLRVSALANGSHGANGHAPFAAGEVGVSLGRVDQQTGEVTPMDKSNVQRAIRKAIALGWLSQQSGSMCLVVPGHAVAGGLGSPGKDCPTHRRATRVGQRVTHPRSESGSGNDHPVSPMLTSRPPADLLERDRALESVLGFSEPDWLEEE